MGLSSSARFLRELREVEEGKCILADYIKLLGLLNHLVCLLGLPYHVMYGMYEVLDTARRANTRQDQPVSTSPRSRKSVQRWIEAVSSRAGTSALVTAFDQGRPSAQRLVVRLFSDAAKLGCGEPALCGNMYDLYWIVVLRPDWRVLPIVVTEFAGAIINAIVFLPMLGGAPTTLVLDALVVPVILASRAHDSPVMQYMHEQFVNLPEITTHGFELSAAHERGLGNIITDAGSRGKIQVLHDVMRNLGLKPTEVQVPAKRVAKLLDGALQVWQQMESDKLCAPPPINTSPSTLHHANGGADVALPKADVSTSLHHASGESAPLGRNSVPRGPDSPSPSAGESSEAAPLGGIMASRPRLFPESPSRVTWARTPTS